MVSQLTNSLQVLGFTHRLIAQGINADVVLYQALCAAYAALLAGQSTDALSCLAVDQLCAAHMALSDYVAVPTMPTPQTLQAAIEIVIKQRDSL